MLKQMRASTKTWPMKLFLGAVIISFGAWGIGDAIAPSVGANTAVKVGDVEVPVSEVKRQFDLRLSQMSGQFGSLSREDAIALGLVDSIVRDLEDTAVVNQAALDMGIVTTQDTLRRGLMRDENFRDANGNFDKGRYLSTLGALRLGESEFLNLLSLNMRESVIFSSIGAATGVPQVLVDTLVEYGGETRQADGLLVRLDALPEPPPPTEEALQARYDETADDFTNPELRHLTLVHLKLDSFRDPSSVSEEDARATYEATRTQYTTGETRQVSQLIFDSREDAEAARSAGETLSAIATASGAGTPVALGTVTATTFPGSVGDAIFALEPGTISEPVESDFGWHLFTVTGVEEESILPFADVRDDITRTLATDAAYDALYKATAKFEDLIAQGTPLEDAAEVVGGEVEVAGLVTAQGLTSKGDAVPGLPTDPDFLRDVFQLDEGYETPMSTVGEDYFTARVDRIVEPAPVPFEDRRESLIEDLVTEARLAQAHSLLAEARARLDAGATFEDVAADSPAIETGLVGPITRSGRHFDPGFILNEDLLGPQITEALFTARPGELIEARAAAGLVLARLTDITIPDAKALSEPRQRVAQTLSNTTSQELLDTLMDVLYDQHRVIVNTPAINALKEG